MRCARSLCWVWLLLLWSGGLAAQPQTPVEVVESVELEFYVGKDPVLVELDTHLDEGNVRVAVSSVSPFWASRGLVPQREEYLGVLERAFDADERALLQALEWGKLEAAAVAATTPAIHERLFRVTRKRRGVRIEYTFSRADYEPQGTYLAELHARILARYARYVTEAKPPGTTAGRAK